MSEIQQQLEQIEIGIDDARETIEKMAILKGMMETQAWKDIIEDGYFRDEASRLVLLKADPGMLEKSEQKQIGIAIAAIGPFRQYLRVIMQLGMMAEQAMQNDQETREELLEEEANEEAA